MKKSVFILIASFLVLIATNQTVVSSQDSPSRLDQIETNVATLSASLNRVTINSTFTEGKVLSISSGIINLSTINGTKIIYTVDTTKVFDLSNSGKTLIGTVDLKTGDNLLVLGLPEQANSGTAKFIARSNVKEIVNFSLFGKVSSVTDSSASIENFTRSDLPTLNLSLPSGLQVNTQGTTTINPGQMQKNDKLVLAGTVDDKGNLTPSKILDLTFQPNPNSTPSAK